MKFFDVVAGTSTGAIIAAALAGCKGADRRPLASPNELINFYLEDAARVFAGRWRTLKGLLRPKFRIGQTKLKQRFAEICCDARLADAAANLIIPAFEGNGAYLFRGGPSWPAGSQPDFYLRDVLLATTAAPYLFPPVRITAIGQQETRDFIDGGLFANNPAMHAYLEARELFGSRREILLLSLGTGNDFHPIDYHTAYRWGGLQLLNPLKGLPLIQAMMQGQSHDTHRNLQRLIPDQHSYIRTRPPLAYAAAVVRRCLARGRAIVACRGRQAYCAKFRAARRPFAPPRFCSGDGRCAQVTLAGRGRTAAKE